MSKFNIQIDGKLKSTTKGNEIWWYGGGAEAWSSLANAKAGVPLAIRSGKTVGVLEDNKIVEYIWYPNDTSDSGLVLKQDALPDNVAFTDIDNDFTANQTFKEAIFDRAFSNNEATANNELVRLDQLNSAVSGLNWQDPIDDILDFTTSEPTSPTIGDRYINSSNGTSSGTGQSVTKNNIYEWDGTDWAEFVPVDGWTVFDRAVDQNFTFNGTSWVEFGSTVSHNNTTGLQGGQAGQYYHLTEAQYLALSGGIDSATLNGQNGAYYLNYNNFSNVPDLSGFITVADLNPYAKLNGGNEFSGNQTISGTISANNLSGTNTGNETKASIDALGVDAATLQGQNGAYYLDYNNFSNVPDTDNYGYFQLQTNSINRKQIASQNVLNFINGAGISISYGSNGAVTISNTITNNNQLTNGAGYVTSSGNTVIGTDDDISNTGAKVIATLVMTDGVITSHTVRTLTLANLGFTGDSNANRITNNSQISNGAGYVTSSGNTVIGTDNDISNTGAKVIATLVMTDGVITSHTVRTLTLANLGFTGDSNANRITNNNQISNGAGYITSAGNTQLSKEQVEDFVGLMVQNNVETNISVTYDDSTNKLNFASVNTQLSNSEVTAITNPLYLGKTSKAVDSDKLDGQIASYYLNYNNFSNTPNLGVYAKLSGGNEFSGNNEFIATDTSGSYSAAAIEVREVNLVASSQSSQEYSPSISFHWGGRYGYRLYTDSSGVLNFGDDDGNKKTVSFGNATFSGNVEINGGVGGLSNGALLVRQNGNTVDNGIAITSSNPTSHRIWKDASGSLNIGTVSNNKQIILGLDGNAIFSGNVDIEGLLYVNRTINEVARFRNSLNNSSPFFSIYQGNSRKGFFQYNNSADSIRIESDTNNIDFFASGTRQLLLANGNATFSGDINLSAGKKLQYSAKSFMTPENNSTGAEISTAGGFTVKTGSTPTLALFIDGSQNATFSGKVEINGGVGASTNGTLVVRQNGETVDNGIAITSSNTKSHRIWKDASGFLNIGTTANNKQIILGLDGNATFSGDISANNLSGTNTGDQDLSSFLTASDISGKANLSGGNIFSGDQTISGKVEINGGVGLTTNGTLVVRQNGNTVDNGIAIIGSNPKSHRIWKDVSGSLNIGTVSDTKQITLGLDGNAIFSGNVGIGTSSPIYKQHISTSGFIGQFIQSSYVNSLKYYSSTLIGRNAVNNESSEFGYSYDSVNPNNSYSYINTFGQIQGSQFALTAIGNVGIGTNIPQAKLDVNGNAIFSGDVKVGGNLRFGDEANISESPQNSAKLRYYGQKHIFQYESDYAKIEVGGIDLFVAEGGANASINYSLGTVNFDKPIKPSGYKSSDGSEGVSNQFFTGGNMITVKNGIITEIIPQT